MARLIGLDIGDKRTGVAVSDELGLTARPLVVLSTNQLADRLPKLISEQKVAAVVVGRPRHLGGELGEQARVTANIVDALRQHVKADFIYEDETATTKEAEQPGRIKASVGKDAAAARVMLQGYLNEHADRRNNAEPQA